MDKLEKSKVDRILTLLFAFIITNIAISIIYSTVVIASVPNKYSDKMKFDRLMDNFEEIFDSK